MQLDICDIMGRLLLKEAVDFLLCDFRNKFVTRRAKRANGLDFIPKGAENLVFNNWSNLILAILSKLYGK